MNPSHATRWLLCGVLLIVALSPQRGVAEGTFDIPAGAHFSRQKLERIGEYFRGEVAASG